MKEYPSVREMDSAQRVKIVREIFSSVTGKYDFLNRLLSLRRDVYWRKRAVAAMHFFRTYRFLDVATGTGDLALDCARMYPEVSIHGIDFVPAMIQRGVEKVENAGLKDRIRLEEGDGTALQFEDQYFDVSAIAFGIRNIPDRLLALKEMSRVVIPGGQVIVLELTTPEPGFWRHIYSFYLNGLLPRFAWLFTRNPSAYEYLADSIMNFPTRSQFLDLMGTAGLIHCQAIPLTLGICTLYIGNKPE